MVKAKSQGMKMNNSLKSIHHDGSSRYVKKTPSTTGLHIGDDISIRLRIGLEPAIERIFLRTCPDGEQLFVEMHIEDPQPQSTRSVCIWWQTTLTLTMPVTSYRFLVFTGENGPIWYNAAGAFRHIPTDSDDFRLLTEYEAPEWVHKSVFYQILPDRFADGDPSNNVRDGEFTYHGHASISRRWGETQSNWPKAMVEFYGGDLPGVESRLDYLSDLGVNAIYMNPIFSSYSNHRYDVTDYYNVDPHLGGNLALESLRHATAAREIRFILDIVPNHCGIMHPWFQETIKKPQAPKAEYFTFRSHPDDYECWLGVKGLPKLNYRSQKLREEMYAGRESIFRRWLKPPYKVDGWRVDVANMLARHGADQLENEVWHGIRRAVKEENPQAYLLGENFFDSTNQLQGDQLDATMNYAGFTNPLWYWLNHFSFTQNNEPRFVESLLPWPTQSLADTWQVYRAAIPWAIARQQFNILGSHDTARIFSVVKEDQARNRLAVGLLMTYIGVPCVYYGDEIGMRANNSLTSRDSMIWEQSAWDVDLRAFYQRLIHLRRESPALLDGGFQILAIEENLLAYQRDTDNELLIIIGNRGPDEHPAGRLPVAHGGIPDGIVFDELFSGMKTTVTCGQIPLPTLPAGVQIWRHKLD